MGRLLSSADSGLGISKVLQQFRKPTVPVATVREQLQAEAESRGAEPGNTDRADARAPGSAHHREPGGRPGADQAQGNGATSTLWFGERGEKWDAIIKANPPVFVLAGETEPKVSALRNFDRAARGRQRGDVKARAEVWAERNLYLPTGGQRTEMAEGDRVPLKTPSTYLLGGITYEASA